MIPMMRRNALIIALAPMVLLPVAAMAQTAPPMNPSTQPTTTSQPASAKDVLNDMLNAAGADKIKPLDPVIGNPTVDKTTVNPVAPNARPQTLMREGSYIVDRTGRLTKTSDGQYELTFDSDSQGQQDPPVLLLPSLKLMMMEDLHNNSSRDAKFRVTGMVTEYLGRNYLLLDKVVIVPVQ